MESAIASLPAVRSFLMLKNEFFLKFETLSISDWTTPSSVEETFTSSTYILSNTE
jgi:hypothetical protein